MTFINTTPCDIVIYDEQRKNIIMTISRSKITIRLISEKQPEFWTIRYGVPIYTYKEVDNMLVFDGKKEIKTLKMFLLRLKSFPELNPSIQCVFVLIVVKALFEMYMVIFLARRDCCFKLPHLKLV